MDNETDNEEPEEIYEANISSEIIDVDFDIEKAKEMIARYGVVRIPCKEVNKLRRFIEKSEQIIAKCT